MSNVFFWINHRRPSIINIAYHSGTLFVTAISTPKTTIRLSKSWSRWSVKTAKNYVYGPLPYQVYYSGSPRPSRTRERHRLRLRWDPRGHHSTVLYGMALFLPKVDTGHQETRQHLEGSCTPPPFITRLLARLRRSGTPSCPSGASRSHNSNVNERYSHSMHISFKENKLLSL